MQQWYLKQNRIENLRFDNGEEISSIEIVQLEQEYGAETFQWEDSSHYYFFYSPTRMNPMSWKEAKNFCEKRGLYLATITSLEENTFVESFIDGSRSYWLGSTDAFQEGYGNGLLQKSGTTVTGTTENLITLMMKIIWNCTVTDDGMT